MAKNAAEVANPHPANIKDPRRADRSVFGVVEARPSTVSVLPTPPFWLTTARVWAREPASGREVAMDEQLRRAMDAAAYVWP